ncbi:hypothetical protein [Rhizobium mesoamericanum]|uniref:hypothetical protein n=1 Tax=Rhizobium mesoamericanum TaxID=1079800 RepID=UPI00041B4E16|nr:hypothetical protein [Rhizobium mesoamericanum]
MPRKSAPYTDAEIALAKRLFAQAQASGTLKPPRGLIAIALSNGYRQSVSQTVTYQDYLRDARQRLSLRVGVSRGRRRK